MSPKQKGNVLAHIAGSTEVRQALAPSLGDSLSSVLLCEDFVSGRLLKMAKWQAAAKGEVGFFGQSLENQPLQISYFLQGLAMTSASRSRAPCPPFPKGPLTDLNNVKLIPTYYRKFEKTQ